MNNLEKKVWGVTGNVGMGKTDLCNILGEKDNVRVLDCDKIAKNLVIADKSIFKDPVKLKAVEDYVHPKVWEYITGQIEADDKEIYIIESAIIFEIGWDKRIPNIIVVRCSPEEQLKRIRRQHASWTREDIEHRLKYQLPIELKERMAKIVIDNEGTKEGLREKAEKVYSIISQRLPEGRIVL